MIRAKKIHKMKKAKHNPVGQFGLLDLVLRLIRSLRGKKKKDATNKIFRALEKKEKIFAKYTLYY
jgi:hypothetical protein